MSVSKDIVISIKKKLNTLFPSTPIYSKRNLSGVRTPCFLVKIINAVNKDLLTAYSSIMTTTVNIVYMANDDVSAEELAEVRESLLFGMREVELIETTTLMRVKDNYSVESTDQDISFAGSYPIMVHFDKPIEPLMEEIEENTIYTHWDSYIKATWEKIHYDPNMWLNPDDQDTKENVIDEDPDNPKTDEEKLDEEGWMEYLEWKHPWSN